MDYDSDQNGARTSRDQSETRPEFRVSYESQTVAKLLRGGKFYHGPNSMAAPHLPVGSPEREALFAELRRTFVEDWKDAEVSLQREREATFGDLYFVAAGDAIKIGRTTNFVSRLRFIQAHNHEEVRCLLLLKGQGWREKEFHRRFRAQRMRGEWFARCPELEAEIEWLNGDAPQVQPQGGDA